MELLTNNEAENTVPIRDNSLSIHHDDVVNPEHFSERHIKTKQTPNVQAELTSIDTHGETKAEKLLTVADINKYSTQELRNKFSKEQLFVALNSLPTYFGDQTIPEENLNAESCIYETYQPSEAMQKHHTYANLSALASYNPKELFILKEKWKSGIEIEQKINFVKAYIQKIAAEYGLHQEIPIAMYDQPFSGEDASWMMSHEQNKIGVLILYKSILENKDLTDILSTISHEIAHGYQESLIKDITEVPEELLTDRDWFKIYTTRHHEKTQYGDVYKSSHTRYRAIPIEQDAWRMQQVAPNELNRILDSYADEVLLKAKLGTYSEMKKQSKIAAWVSRNLKATTTVEDLAQEAEKVVLFQEFHSQLTDFISGKDRNTIEIAVKQIEVSRRKADELLGLAA